MNDLHVALINSLNWRRAWFIDCLVSLSRRFLIIFNIDDAVMGQWWGCLEGMWCQIGVAARGWVNYLYILSSRVFLSFAWTQTWTVRGSSLDGIEITQLCFTSVPLAASSKSWNMPVIWCLSDVPRATLNMHFRHIFRSIISLSLSVVVFGFIDYSDFTQPYDESESLLIDPNTPLFDEEFSSPLDSLAFLDQSTDPETTSSDILWDDSFKIASCSTPSRAKRAEDAASCPDVSTEDANKITTSLTQGEFSVTCAVLTRGFLPFALIPSAAPQDTRYNFDGLLMVATIGVGPRPFLSATLYRATLGTYEKSSNPNDITYHLMLI